MMNRYFLFLLLFLLLAGCSTGVLTVERQSELVGDSLIPTPTVPVALTVTPEREVSISGHVWHDLCVSAAPTEPDPIVAPPNCVADGRGDLHANGMMESDEPGIASIQLTVGSGACPAIPLNIATTDQMGTYTFQNLAPGRYCISVDAHSAVNASILLPGTWTFPRADNSATTIAATEVALDAGETANDVDFGWDHQFLPEPTPTATPLPTATPTTVTVQSSQPEPCQDRASFVGETIPDGTHFRPDESFTKSWRLRNSGSCVWSREYVLFAFAGAALPAPASVPLPVEVRPGLVVEIEVPMQAPAEPGLYTVYWALRDAAGRQVDMTNNRNDAVWVEILVEAPAPQPLPGTGGIGGTVWQDACPPAIPSYPIPTDLPAGCVWSATGCWHANGVREAGESGLLGVAVDLGAGVCPASRILQTTTTDASGNDRFRALPAGSYCVSITVDAGHNASLLPGEWSYPGAGRGESSLTVADGKQLLDIDFGWDHAFLPEW